MFSLSGRQYVLAVILTLVVLTPSMVLGANILPEQIVPKSCAEPGGCKDICAIAELVQNILNAGIVISVFLSAGLFAFAGLKMLISPASPSQQGQAKTLFLNVLIGFIIILASWLIIDTVMRVMLGSNPALPWNKICQN